MINCAGQVLEVYRMWGSGKPLRFEHWGAREVFPFYRCTLKLAKILRTNSTNSQHRKRHEVYTGSGHRCGVIPYSSVVVDGLPLGLMMNTTREEQPPQVEVFLSECW